jgi:hypothetical protein
MFLKYNRRVELKIPSCPPINDRVNINQIQLCREQQEAKSLALFTSMCMLH